MNYFTSRVHDLEESIGMYEQLFGQKMDLKYCFKYICIE